MKIAQLIVTTVLALAILAVTAALACRLGHAVLPKSDLTLPQATVLVSAFAGWVIVAVAVMIVVARGNGDRWR
jgi:hypothetical protein